MPESPRDILESLFRAAVAAADPGAALVTELERDPPALPARLYLLGLGKAAPAMAAAALGWCRATRRPVAGGLVVGADLLQPQALDGLPFFQGDHPVPGERSFLAAAAVDRLTRELRTDDEVWVLLSGGTSSLAGAPVAGVSPADYVALHQLLLRSGLDIAEMNRVRKRVSLWSAGRLALALSPARVRVFAISDVAGDDLAALGSGPCAPDATSAAELKSLLVSEGLWERLPPTVSGYVDEVIAGLRGETPKFDDPRFSRVRSVVLANTRTALEGAARAAEATGIRPVIQGEFTGNAAAEGATIAEALLAAWERGEQGVFLWGGETTVVLSGEEGRGGRCQELALSAAIRLAEAGAGESVSLLAAGTDGRDGPTDAAGAIVDGRTIERINYPVEHLARHDAYPALHQAGALLVTGPTGTNVRDIVVGSVTSDQ